MTKPLTVGGLFSGIGGWELGLERAGMEVAWHCDADPFCRRVLEKHWPGVPVFDDVLTLTAETAGGVDVLCGGFPCQDVSTAGANRSDRLGLDGERSGLWSEYRRLVDEFRPRYVLVENVAALRSRGLGRVLGDLAALGYDAEWDVLSACAFGAPHTRERLFLVAYPASERRIQGWGSRPQAESAQLERSGPGAGGPWATEPRPVGVAYGLPDRSQRTKGLGNALVPQIAEWIGRRIVAYEENQCPLPASPAT